MFPWFWLWSPQFHLPFSGSLTQDISPQTDWFFDAINPQAGNSEIEKAIFDVASYGKQLGLILDVLVPFIENQTPSSEQVSKLKNLYTTIHQVKAENKAHTAKNLTESLRLLATRDPQLLAKILQEISETRITIDKSAS